MNGLVDKSGPAGNHSKFNIFICLFFAFLLLMIANMKIRMITANQKEQDWGQPLLAAKSNDNQLVLSEFCTPSRFRQFKLIIENRQVYVNASSLAELSTYFETLCFNECYKECVSGEAKIETEKFDDIVELLNCMCKQKQVSGTNFCTILRYAHMWEIESLKSACEEYIAVKSNIDQLSDNEAISALESIANLTMKKSAVINLIERLAPIGFDSICRIGQHCSMPNKVAFALIDACRSYEFLLDERSRKLDEATKHRGRMFFTGHNCVFGNNRSCYNHNIVTRCKKCLHYYCQLHLDFKCTDCDQVDDVHVRIRAHLLD